MRLESRRGRSEMRILHLSRRMREISGGDRERGCEERGGEICQGDVGYCRAGHPASDAQFSAGLGAEYGRIPVEARKLYCGLHWAVSRDESQHGDTLQQKGKGYAIPSEVLPTGNSDLAEVQGNTIFVKTI